MPFMKTDMTLRGAPNGASIHVIANMHSPVDVLGTDGEWSKVKVLDFDQEPEGWVQTSAVDLTGTPPISELKPKDPSFARQCWWEALFADINPHYLIAVAQVRQTELGPIGNNNVGPFRLTSEEWEVVRNDPKLGLGAFKPKDNADWVKQCTAFALMVRSAEEGLEVELEKIKAGRKPTPAELLFAQLVGPAAVAQTDTNGNISIKTILEGLGADKLPPGLPTTQKIIDRYARLLSDAATPPVPLSAKVAFKKTSDTLQAAVNEVRAVVESAGMDVLGNQPDDLIDHINKELNATPPPSDMANAPGGHQTKIPGAGGTLGELIARGESSGDYNIFNRGNAGDSVGQHIDFIHLPLAEIMKYQALPKGHHKKLLAVGKYQLIPGTLRDAISKLGIDKATEFSAQVQERCFRLFLVGIKRPAVKNFVTGAGGSLFNAQLALALEFAAVARPDTGRSNYGGVAGNKASISAGETKVALETEKSRFEALRATGKSANDAWLALSPGAA